MRNEEVEEAEQRHIHHTLAVFWWLGCVAGAGATIIILLVAGELTA